MLFDGDGVLRRARLQGSVLREGRVLGNTQFILCAAIKTAVVQVLKRRKNPPKPPICHHISRGSRDKKAPPISHEGSKSSPLEFEQSELICSQNPMLLLQKR